MSISGQVLQYLNYFLNMRWVRFGIIGGAATLTYFLLGLLFVKFLSWPLLPGNAAAYLLSFVVSYLGQSRWTFQSKNNDLRELPKFAFAQLAGLIVNSIVIDICARLNIIYEISMLIATAVAPIFVYILCKIWVFRPANDKS